MGSMHPVQVIAVTGGKGGVGKTNVSVNLSIALAELGRRVMLMDADLGLANVDVLLGLTPKFTLADVVEDLRRYYPGRILLLNEDMAAKRVSGSFPSQDPVAVLNALQAVLGFEQHSLLGRMIVLR